MPPHESTAAVVYAGEPGAFAEDAVIAAFGDIERTAVGSFRQVFEAVADSGPATAGVVPIENVVNGTVWARTFGTARLGQIQGMAMSATITAAALAPLVPAIALSLTGSYELGLVTLAVVAAVALVLSFRSGVRE